MIIETDQHVDDQVQQEISSLEDITGVTVF